FSIAEDRANSSMCAILPIVLSHSFRRDSICPIVPFCLSTDLNSFMHCFTHSHDYSSAGSIGLFVRFFMFIPMCLLLLHSFLYIIVHLPVHSSLLRFV
ncbi:hypothetical protein PRIPAC_82380, partial [Pristionchus pacificus]